MRVATLLLLLLAALPAAVGGALGQLWQISSQRGPFTVTLTYSENATGPVAFARYDEDTRTLFLVQAADNSSTVPNPGCRVVSQRRIIVGPLGCSDPANLADSVISAFCASDDVQLRASRALFEAQWYLRYDVDECTAGDPRICVGPILLSIDNEDSFTPKATLPTAEELLSSRMQFVQGAAGPQALAPVVVPVPMRLPRLVARTDCNGTGGVGFNGTYENSGVDSTSLAFGTVWKAWAKATAPTFFRVLLEREGGEASNSFTIRLSTADGTGTDDEYYRSWWKSNETFSPLEGAELGRYFLDNWLTFLELGVAYPMVPASNLSSGACSLTLDITPATDPPELEPLPILTENDYFLGLPRYFYSDAICNYAPCFSDENGLNLFPDCPEGSIRGGTVRYIDGSDPATPIYVPADEGMVHRLDCESFYPLNDSFVDFGTDGTDGTLTPRSGLDLGLCFAPFPAPELIPGFDGGTGGPTTVQQPNERERQCFLLGGRTYGRAKTYCAKSVTEEHCQENWDGYFNQECFYKFRADTEARFQVSQDRAREVCEGLFERAEPLAAPDTATRNWLQSWFLALPPLTAETARYRVANPDGTCTCFDAADFSIEDPCACLDPAFPICVYPEDAFEVPYRYTRMSLESAALFKQGQNGPFWTGEREAVCQCEDGWTGRFCERLACPLQSLLAEATNTRPITTFALKCSNFGSCYNGQARVCVCELYYGPAAAYDPSLPELNRHRDYPCGFPSTPNAPANASYEIDGVIFTGVTQFLPCNGVGSGVGVSDNSTTNRGQCLCVQRAIPHSCFPVSSEPHKDGAACSGTVPVRPCGGHSPNGEIVAALCNGQGTSCPFGERLENPATNVYAAACFDENAEPQVGCVCDNGWGGEACTCLAPFDLVLGKGSVQTFEAQTLFVDLGERVLIRAVNISGSRCVEANVGTVQVSDEVGKPDLTDDCVFNATTNVWDCPGQIARRFVAWSPLVPGDLASLDGCRAFAYERFFQFCGANETVSPFAPRFFALPEYRSGTINILGTPAEQGAYGCTAGACQCGPEWGGRECRVAVSSVRPTESNQGKRTSFAKRYCGEEILVPTAEDVVGSAGSIDPIEGNCSCSALARRMDVTGTSGRTLLEGFSGRACKCFEAWNADRREVLPSAGHGVCEEPDFPFCRCQQDRIDEENDALSEPFVDVTQETTLQTLTVTELSTLAGPGALDEIVFFPGPTQDGSVGPAQEADAQCAAQGVAAGCRLLKAVLTYNASYQIVDYPELFGFSPQSPIVGPDGVVIQSGGWTAAFQAGLENSLLAAGAITELGWWTGSNPPGTVSTATCLQWTSGSGGDTGAVAVATATAVSPTASWAGAAVDAGFACDFSTFFSTLCMCLGGSVNATSPPTAMPTGQPTASPLVQSPLVLHSDETRRGGDLGNTSVVDGICAADALAQGLACVDSVAVLGRPGAPLTDFPSTYGFSSASSPLYGPTGILVANSWSQFVTGTEGIYAENTLVGAEVVSPGVGAWWTGVLGNGTVSSATCNDWTDTAGNGMAGSSGALNVDLIEDGLDACVFSPVFSPVVVCLCVGAQAPFTPAPTTPAPTFPPDSGEVRGPLTLYQGISVSQDGALGNQGTTSAVCAAEAVAQGLTNCEFTPAFLSYNASYQISDFPTIFDFTGSSVLQLADGTAFALSWDTALNGGAQRLLGPNGLGLYWTGSDANGNVDPAGFTCDQWTSGDVADDGATADGSSTTSSWLTDGLGNSCDNTFTYNCLCIPPVTPTGSPTNAPTRSPVAFQQPTLGNVAYRVPVATRITAEGIPSDVDYCPAAGDATNRPLVGTRNLTFTDALAPIWWRDVLYREYDPVLNQTVTRNVTRCNPAEFAQPPGTAVEQGPCPYYERCRTTDCSDELRPGFFGTQDGHVVTGEWPDLRGCVCSFSEEERLDVAFLPAGTYDILLILCLVADAALQLSQVEALNFGNINCNNAWDREVNCAFQRIVPDYVPQCTDQPIGCYDYTLGAIFGAFWQNHPTAKFSQQRAVWDPQRHYKLISTFFGEQFCLIDGEFADLFTPDLLNACTDEWVEPESLNVESTVVTAGVPASGVATPAYQVDLIQGRPFTFQPNGTLVPPPLESTFAYDGLAPAGNTPELAALCLEQFDLSFDPPTACHRLGWTNITDPRSKRIGYTATAATYTPELVNAPAFVLTLSLTFDFPEAVQLAGVEVYNQNGDLCGQLLRAPVEGETVVFSCLGTYSRSPERDLSEGTASQWASGGGVQIRYLGAASVWDVPETILNPTTQAAPTDPLADVLVTDIFDIPIAGDLVNVLLTEQGGSWNNLVGTGYNIEGTGESIFFPTGNLTRYFPQRDGAFSFAQSGDSFLTYEMRTVAGSGSGAVLRAWQELVDEIVFNYTYPDCEALRATREAAGCDLLDVNLTSPLHQERLYQLWAVHLAPRLGTEDSQCETAGRGLCTYADDEQVKEAWLNGEDRFNPPYEFQGKEGGSRCFDEFPRGYYYFQLGCRVCTPGYGPVSTAEWDAAIQYSLLISQTFSFDVFPFNVYPTLEGDALIDFFEAAISCRFPWGKDPVVAALGTGLNLCAGHGFVSFQNSSEVVTQQVWVDDVGQSLTPQCAAVLDLGTGERFALAPNVTFVDAQLFVSESAPQTSYLSVVNDALFRNGTDLCARVRCLQTQVAPKCEWTCEASGDFETLCLPADVERAQDIYWQDLEGRFLVERRPTVWTRALSLS